MASTNVRISSTSHEILRRLAREEKQPMQVILDKAVERYRRARFLNGANADFAALRNNSGALERGACRAATLGNNRSGRVGG
jgi:hypothetical protein